jgi:Arc/MetJ-type ribon-helix-helix transcriptional regulator
MRTSKTLSISLPPTQLKQVERLAKKENRTMSELIREALRHYEQRQASPINADLIAALKAVQENARAAGLDKLSSREIDSEIAAYRKQTAKRTKQLVR